MKDWQRSEREAAEAYGNLTPGSGAGMRKMDIEGKDEFSNFKVENKFTAKDSYSLTAEVIKKAIRQAKPEKALLRIDFGSHNLQVIVLEEKEWIRLNEVHRQGND